MHHCSRSEWPKFKKYHYLNGSISKAAQCLGLYDKNKIIGFCGVISQLNARHKHLRRVTRLVILPDYQGVGLGTKFLTFVAQYWNKLGCDLCIDTSAKNLIYALRKNNQWRMTGYGISPDQSKTSSLNKIHTIRKVPMGRFMFK